jgi:putative ABC transport system ATP-binding protein
VTHENDIAAHARRVLRMRDGLVLSDRRQVPVLARAGGEGRAG